MHNYAPLLIVGFSATLLAGCSSTGGGGGGAGGGGGTPSPAVFAASAGTASEALADGETLTAYSSQMSAAVEHDFDAQHTRALDPTTFSIATNAQGALDVTIDGVLYSFAAADIEVGSLEFEAPGGAGPYYRVDSWQGDVVDVLDVGNGSHHQVWSYFWDPAGQAISGFAVVGTETMPDALVAKANATYSGTAGARLTNSNSFNNTTTIYGDLAMAADFNAGLISGGITNIAEPGDTPGAGSVTLNQTTISEAGFAGTIWADSALETRFSLTNLGGTYSGKFYGAGGGEVAGVMEISGDDTVGTGFFSGTQD